MKALIVILFLFAQTDKPLFIGENYNENQFIILFAPTNQNDLYNQALLNLTKNPLGLDERDIVIFEIFEQGGIRADNSSLSQEEAIEFRDYFKVDKEAFTMILLNYQKEELRRSDKPVNLNEIFSVFDSAK